jgi:hypothetical protein
VEQPELILSKRWGTVVVRDKPTSQTNKIKVNINILGRIPTEPPQRPNIYTGGMQAQICYLIRVG